MHSLSHRKPSSSQAAAAATLLLFSCFCGICCSIRCFTFDAEVEPFWRRNKLSSHQCEGQTSFCFYAFEPVDYSVGSRNYTFDCPTGGCGSCIEAAADRDFKSCSNCTTDLCNVILPAAADAAAGAADAAIAARVAQQPFT